MHSNFTTTILLLPLMTIAHWMRPTAVLPYTDIETDHVYSDFSHDLGTMLAPQLLHFSLFLWYQVS